MCKMLMLKHLSAGVFMINGLSSKNSLTNLSHFLKYNYKVSQKSKKFHFELYLFGNIQDYFFSILFLLLKKSKFW